MNSLQEVTITTIALLVLGVVLGLSVASAIDKSIINEVCYSPYLPAPAGTTVDCEELTIKEIK